MKDRQDVFLPETARNLSLLWSHNQPPVAFVVLQVLHDPTEDRGMEQDTLQTQEGGPLRRAAPSHWREPEGPGTERRPQLGALQPRPGGSGADSVQDGDEGGYLHEVVEREATR